MTRRRAIPPFRGTIGVPGDKSVSHRAVILGAMAAGTTRISGANRGLDVGATIDCVRALGADVKTLDQLKGELEVEGPGARGLREARSVLDAGNSGTTVRLLAGVCAGIDGLSVLTGDASLRRRPMRRVVDPLRAMGARIDGARNADRVPLAIRGGTVRALEWALPVASAQVKSALLLAGLRAEGPVTVVEPRSSRDHTELLLEAMGVEVTRAGTAVTIVGPQTPAATHVVVPGDVSSALYLLVAAALVPGSDLEVTNVGLNPTRTAALDVLRRMGAVLEIEPTGTAEGEPRGRVRARASELRATEVGGDEIPRLIDDIPVLAAAATQAQGTTVFHGVGELRVKESNRLTALDDELGKVGAHVEIEGDALLVHGPTPLHEAETDSRGDHRIALALAVAGLATGSNVRVRGWSCTETSFPEFLELAATARSKAGR